MGLTNCTVIVTFGLGSEGCRLGVLPWPFAFWCRSRVFAVHQTRIPAPGGLVEVMTFSISANNTRGSRALRPKQSGRNDKTDMTGPHGGQLGIQEDSLQRGLFCRDGTDFTMPKPVFWPHAHRRLATADACQFFHLVDRFLHGMRRIGDKGFPNGHGVRPQGLDYGCELNRHSPSIPASR